ncbi:zinc finger protein VAR3, chloroplastic-like isoform X2 [Abrus precatorius]|uniref:Zinc finger protein VAR3, chloroplastic-like isoform X2 n=1 Tax=Abrus precatorius TaxID=3816 RepID=A0A8B8KFT4_ABRPR|nr:zinc finger protein VAR3, chloroplastic-like isoform X2 [Abrus precatorius]
MLRNVWKRCHTGLDPALLSCSPIHSTTFSPSSKLHFVEREEPHKLQILHPWPEWVEFMKCLLNKGHFQGNPFQFTAKDSNLVRTASLNFGRDHFHLLRFLSRKDIGVTVAFGCPSLDRKVINSGKRLRAYVGIDEGNVCSACNLRGDCERAFVKAREDEGGRTVDVMRIILTHGLDPVIGSVENKSCLTRKVEESVRRLLKEIVEHSAEDENSNFPDTTRVAIGHVHLNPQNKGKIDVPMKQGDWVCPKCNFINFARNIKCLRCDCFFEERIKQLQEDNNHLPLKKGDWICNKCNFLNFARNTRCLQCKERPSNRHLNPGEWECDSCNYLNFRRNMVCLKCDHRRPIVSKASNSSLQPQQEDEDHHKNSKFTFVVHQDDSRDKSPMVFERMNKKRDSPMWRFVEERNENSKFLSKSNDPSQFVDFRITGGKTELSEAQKREAYKKELPNRCTRPLWQGETDDEFCSSDNHSTDDEFCSADNQNTDDEEMEEWFGKGKIER